MFSNSNFKKISIFLSIIVILIFVSYYFLYLDIKKRNEHISFLTNSLLAQQEEEKYALSTEKAVQSFSSDIELINSSIVPSSGDIKFIEDLEEMARKDGLILQIESLSLEDNNRLTVGGLTLFKIKAKALGSWTATYKFLDRLESLPFKTRIFQFAFLGQETDGGNRIKKVEWQSAFEFYVLKYK